MGGMWQLFQIARRIFLLALGGFIVLSLAWAFLPFPSGESDGDDGTDYSSKVLLSGKTLTRVYELVTPPYVRIHRLIFLRIQDPHSR